MDGLRDIASVKPCIGLLSAVDAPKSRDIGLFSVLSASKSFNVLSEAFTESILSRIGNFGGLYSLLASFPLEYLLDDERKDAPPANIQLKLFLNSIAEMRERAFVNKNIGKIAANVSEHLHLKYSVKNYNNYSSNVLRNTFGGNNPFIVNMFNYSTPGRGGRGGNYGGGNNPFIVNTFNHSAPGRGGHGGNYGGGNNPFIVNMFNHSTPGRGGRGGNYGGGNVFNYVSKEQESSSRLLKSVLHYLSVFNSHIKGSNPSGGGTNVTDNVGDIVGDYSNRVPGVFELINRTHIEQKNTYTSGDTASHISSTVVNPIIRHFDFLFNSSNNRNSYGRDRAFAADYSVSNISRNVIGKVTRQFDNLFSTFSGDIYNKVMSQYITNVQNINSGGVQNITNGGDNYENRSYNVYGSYGDTDYSLVTPASAGADTDGASSSTAMIANRLRRHFALLFGGLGKRISDTKSGNVGTIPNRYGDVRGIGTARGGGSGGYGSVQGNGTRDGMYYSGGSDSVGDADAFLDNITITSRNIAKRLTRHIETLLSSYGVGINRRGNFTVLNVGGFNRAQGGVANADGIAGRDMPSVSYNVENEYRNFSLVSPIRKMESDIQSITKQIMSSIVPKYKAVTDFIDGKTGASPKNAADVSERSKIPPRLKHIDDEKKADGVKNTNAVNTINTEKVNNFSDSIKSHSDTDNDFYDKSDAVIKDLAYLSVPATAVTPAETVAEPIDFGKDVPIWASRFLNSSMKNKPDLGGVVPEFNTVTGAFPAQNGNNSQNTVWNAPQYNNSYRQNEIVLKKNEETTNNYRQSISRTEINNVANRVYEIIEKRVGVERRRLGF
ncbi:hypothetical protein FACS1894133_1660 [Clostridia bacterium]|nr:hypothetical protein FACS1894133_1660 [Clostridia bacterium]